MSSQALKNAKIALEKKKKEREQRLR